MMPEEPKRSTDGDAAEKNRDLGKHPLHLAIENKGTHVDVPDKSGTTPYVEALEKECYDIIESLLKASAYFKNFLQKIIVAREPQESRTIIVHWDIRSFVQSELSDIEDLRESITVTEFLWKAQAVACKDYVDQTWGEIGLKILDLLIEALKNGHSTTKVSDIIPKMELRSKENETRITIESSSLEEFIDITEQIAWFGCVFEHKDTPIVTGPFLTTPRFLASGSDTFTLSFEQYPLPFPDDLLWTKFLRDYNLAVGFSVKNREDGMGVEIPFSLLLRLFDIAVPIEYRPGTILQKGSTTLYLSKILKHGIQWRLIGGPGSLPHHLVHTSNMDKFPQLPAYVW